MTNTDGLVDMNASFSTIEDVDMLSDDEDELSHNISESDIDDDYGGSGSTSTVQGQQSHHISTTTRSLSDTDPHSIPYDMKSGAATLPTTFDEATEPIEYFKLFFNDDLMTLICNETNLFANKKRAETNFRRTRLHNWKNLTHVELDAFLGTIINMDLDPLPAIDIYFSDDWENRVPFFENVFNRDEFLNIYWNLHFNHVLEEVSPVRRDYLISPVLEHLRNMSKLFYNTSNHVSVDASTISFKAKVHFCPYNPNKPTIGLKVFVISDVKNGYLYDFLPLYGPKTSTYDDNRLKTIEIVKELSESVVMKAISPAKGVHVHTDRYLTSPKLADELQKIGCLLTDTVITSSTGLPVPPGNKQKRGEVTAKRNLSSLCTSSKGSQNHTTSDIERNRQSNKVLDELDQSDHFPSPCQLMRRTQKWYRKMFFWLFEVAIINSYVLYKEKRTSYGKTPMDYRQYRMSLVKSLMAEKAAVTLPKPKKRARPAKGPPNQRLDGTQHYMDRRVKGTSKCVVCSKRGIRRETIYYCKTCAAQPPLHPDTCFEQYHTVMDF